MLSILDEDFEKKKNYNVYYFFDNLENVGETFFCCCLSQISRRCTSIMIHNIEFLFT